MNILRIDTRAADATEAIDRLRAKLAPEGDVVSPASRQRTIEVFGEPLTASQVVERICQDVRERGIEAVLQYTAKIDKVDLTAETLRVPAAELAAAHAQADEQFLATIRRIRADILAFQTALVPSDVEVTTPTGDLLRQHYVPLARVGLCVPGGAAAYPSTVLMTAVPAQAAGVQQLAVVAPPTPFGAYNNDLLATCHELGIDEVYRVGGAQAVAALAYGVDGLPRVDKIVGPGNLFVALAKKFVFGEVDIDSIAGPSEIVIIADDAARLTDRLAPEHLQIATDDPQTLLDNIRNAGAVFLGHDTPVALGDYVAGPSHVLPTGGTARFASGLSAADFLRSHSVIRFTRAGLDRVADDLRTMADKEGLTAHRASLDIRLDGPSGVGGEA